MVKQIASFAPNHASTNTPSLLKNAAKELHQLPLIDEHFSPSFEQSETMLVSSFTIASQQPQTQLSPDQTFEPIAPDTSILFGFGIVVILSIIASFVWANEVVPVSRTKLALSKRDGDVKKYLDELREGEEYNDEDNESLANENEGKKKGSDGRDFERWLFTDWLENNKSAGKPGRKKEPALPILKNAKWNSGDNPVLVTFAIMMVGVVIVSITERTGGSF